ncbi:MULTISPECIES: ATP synthase F1 subunit gamma [Salegentibacter]|jgi:F-type H+-transporting ATPase subunit gamma|uniref:ATP synthase gamma chain n=1 Tax=Salegentibacter agarivorans TaxID=345907 RepID=A0A1I2M7H5_9FLAO|nr:MULTISPECIES: ATP synthase F1 subunit gamma [Salegentibacter]MBO2543706.1 ATP synthase F1 subunit gamma [Salegentibacter sp. BDJ18]SFF85141.1 ATP synthase F1 subcomplex gamma subunit [Salegentibacter agarivorans]|tara:strand:- start:53 stop:913 length:861 start_codon:yes stop_codon:yes gene_type:complete
MANLKELRSRITSVSSTMQITSAMKMVSAAKLSRAQDAITQMRPYSEKLTQLLQDLSATLDDDTSSKYAEDREVKNVLVVAISSNKGLAGAFNTNIVKGVRYKTKNDYQSKNVSLYTLGKKANDVLKKDFEVYKNNNEIYDDLTFENVSEIAEELMQLFLDEKYDKIVLVYNQFKNAATQIVQHEQFLPIEQFDTEEEKQLDYLFEPSKIEIVKELIPKSLKMQLFKALRDSFASEHGARMTAMHKATDNAKELRDDLKLSYNKARQASITNEILEIVGGAEALNG